MAVVIRMARAGAKNKPFFHIVAADKTASRDGRYLERLGTYNPKVKGEARVKVDFDAVNAWLKKGAIPSETVGQLLKAASKSK